MEEGIGKVFSIFLFFLGGGGEGVLGGKQGMSTFLKSRWGISRGFPARGAARGALGAQHRPGDPRDLQHRQCPCHQL